MKIVKRGDEYIIIPETDKQLAALKDIEGSRVNINKSDCFRATHSHLLVPSQSMAS